MNLQLFRQTKDLNGFIVKKKEKKEDDLLSNVPIHSDGCKSIKWWSGLDGPFNGCPGGPHIYVRMVFWNI